MELIHIKHGELMATLTTELAARNITDGAIVSLIGGADRFTISTMPKDDATKDNISTYAYPAEMHGCGDIANGVVHIHATMGIEGDQGVAGHLHEAHISTHFANVYVLPLTS
ncbi:PCC domain-containing protein [Nonomuraea sp. NPDC050556]|uniref:PCC domain-containing protein n=1 Tax=Nonomuraea sp. NPDC050556 TaxID=3364369 RepID=UPI0037B02AD1